MRPSLLSLDSGLGPWTLSAALIVGSLSGCGVFTTTQAPSTLPMPSAVSAPSASAVVSPTVADSGSASTQPVMLQTKSRWVPVAWSGLPGWPENALSEAFAAWSLSCQRPVTANAKVCVDVQRLQGAGRVTQQQWLEQTFQAYRVETLQGGAEGLLTAYYEPVFDASRVPRPGFQVPIYAPPAGLATRKPWYTREEINTLPQARAALQGKELLYLADPVDAMVLHIQGSGRMRVTEADSRTRMVRMAFAGTNDQPYKSIGSWLLEQGLTRDATWPGIKAWLSQNPTRVNELLWKNPRMVFFKEELLNGQTASQGPKGAQGVPLTAGRSIAVDPGSIPYGSPVWLYSPGPQTSLQKLVIAQDTGSAIQGAVRADYFVGSGDAAGDLAGRLKQDLKLWVLLPR